MVDSGGGLLRFRWFGNGLENRPASALSRGVDSGAGSGPVLHSMAQVIAHPAEVAEDLPFRPEKAGRVREAPMFVDDLAR